MFKIIGNIYRNSLKYMYFNIGFGLTLILSMLTDFKICNLTYRQDIQIPSDIIFILWIILIIKNFKKLKNEY